MSHGGALCALYGVTMQEPGISSLVSLRLEDKHELPSPTATGSNGTNGKSARTTVPA